ncbi:MAG TPA: hypothetical protein PLG97_03600 [Alcaligenes sp.]|nr:hypothetical protein [Alcaligenes sp.]HRL26579.1 hypothetical protein [Alcaligenes sp.]
MVVRADSLPALRAGSLVEGPFRARLELVRAVRPPDEPQAPDSHSKALASLHGPSPAASRLTRPDDHARSLTGSQGFFAIVARIEVLNLGERADVLFMPACRAC